MGERNSLCDGRKGNTGAGISNNGKERLSCEAYEDALTGSPVKRASAGVAQQSEKDKRLDSSPEIVKVDRAIDALHQEGVKGVGDQSLRKLIWKEGALQALAALDVRTDLPAFLEKYRKQNGKPFDLGALKDVPLSMPDVNSDGSVAQNGEGDEKGRIAKRTLQVVLSGNATQEDWKEVALLNANRSDVISLAASRAPQQREAIASYHDAAQLLEAARAKSFLGFSSLPVFHNPDLEKVRQILGSSSGEAVQRLQDASEKMAPGGIKAAVAGDPKLEHLLSSYGRGGQGLDKESAILNGLYATAPDGLISSRWSWWNRVPAKREGMQMLNVLASCKPEELNDVLSSIGGGDRGRGVTTILQTKKLQASIKEAAEILVNGGLDANGKMPDKTVKALVDVAKKHEDADILRLALNYASSTKLKELKKDEEALTKLGGNDLQQEFIRASIDQRPPDLVTLINANTSKTYKDRSEIERLVTEYGSNYRQQYLNPTDPSFRARVDESIDRASKFAASDLLNVSALLGLSDRYTPTSEAWAAARKAELRGDESLSVRMLGQVDPAKTSALDMPKIVDGYLEKRDFDYFKKNPGAIEQLRNDLGKSFNAAQTEAIVATLSQRLGAKDFEESRSLGKPNLLDSLCSAQTGHDLILLLKDYATDSDRAAYKDNAAYRQKVDASVQRILEQTHDQLSPKPTNEENSSRLTAFRVFCREALKDASHGAPPGAYARLAADSFERNGVDKRDSQLVIDDLEKALRSDPSLKQAFAGRKAQWPKTADDFERRIVLAGSLEAAWDHTRTDLYEQVTKSELLNRSGMRVLQSGLGDISNVFQSVDDRMSVWDRMKFVGTNDSLRRLEVFEKYSNPAEKQLALDIATYPAVRAANPQVAAMLDDKNAYAHIIMQDRQQASLHKEQPGKDKIDQSAADEPYGAATLADLVHLSAPQGVSVFRVFANRPEYSALLKSIGDNPDLKEKINRELLAKYGDNLAVDFGRIPTTGSADLRRQSMSPVTLTPEQRIIGAMQDHGARVAPRLHDELSRLISSSADSAKWTSDRLLPTYSEWRAKQAMLSAEDMPASSAIANLEQADLSYAGNIRGLNTPVKLASYAALSVGAFYSGVGIAALPRFTRLPTFAAFDVGVLKAGIPIVENRFDKYVLRENLSPQDTAMNTGFAFGPATWLAYLGAGKGLATGGL